MPHANPIIRAAWQKQYRIRNAECLKAKQKAWREANRERRLHQKKEYYYRTHDRWQKYAHQRYKTHKNTKLPSEFAGLLNL